MHHPLDPLDPLDSPGRFLRARQLANLLLNAPLLSLSRLHVTAVMSHAHVEDGMVDYVEAVSRLVYTHVDVAVAIPPREDRLTRDARAR